MKPSLSPPASSFNGFLLVHDAPLHSTGCLEICMHFDPCPLSYVVHGKLHAVLKNLQSLLRDHHVRSDRLHSVWLFAGQSKHQQEKTRKNGGEGARRWTQARKTVQVFCLSSALVLWAQLFCSCIAGQGICCISSVHQSCSDSQVSNLLPLLKPRQLSMQQGCIV